MENPDEVGGPDHKSVLRAPETSAPPLVTIENFVNFTTDSRTLSIHGTEGGLNFQVIYLCFKSLLILELSHFRNASDSFS